MIFLHHPGGISGPCPPNPHRAFPGPRSDPCGVAPTGFRRHKQQGLPHSSLASRPDLRTDLASDKSRQTTPRKVRNGSASPSEPRRLCGGELQPARPSARRKVEYPKVWVVPRQCPTELLRKFPSRNLASFFRARRAWGQPRARLGELRLALDTPPKIPPAIPRQMNTHNRFRTSGQFAAAHLQPSSHVVESDVIVLSVREPPAKGSFAGASGKISDMAASEKATRGVA